MSGNMEFVQPQENLEVAADVSAAERSLGEATYEAESHVEQRYEHTEAEAVESSMTTLVDSIVESTERTQTPAQPGKIISEIDPDTGQSKSSGGTSGSSAAAEAPALSQEKTGLAGADKSGIGAPRDSGGEQKPDQKAPLSQLDGDLEIASDDGSGKQRPQVVTAFDDLDSEQGQIGLAEKDPARVGAADVERQLPDTRNLGIGMGKDGMIARGPGGMSRGGMIRGGRTSGGGPPVGQYGGGSKGDVTFEGYTKDKNGTVDSFSGTSKDSCESVASRAADIAEWSEKSSSGTLVDCDDGSLYTIEYDGNHVTVTHYVQTFDGDQPMPYTGSGTGQHEDLPHGTEEGPDKEASFLRLMKSPKTGSTATAYGYGSSGGSTFSPDGGGEADDSGKFFGGLFGSSDRPNNPDEPDYYTPNVLAEANASKRIVKG